MRGRATALALAAALGVALDAAPARAADEGGEPLAIVAHADWDGLGAISLPVLRQLWLGRRTRLAGERVRCLDLSAGSAPREGFTRAVIGWSERALDRYWLRQALSGGPPPPRELATAEELLALVARQPGAIGYVAWRDVAERAPPGVRVVPVERSGLSLRPPDPAYPIVAPPP